MSVRKKIFSCGHRGKGKYCHECARIGLSEKKKQEAELVKELRVKSARIVRKKRSKLRKEIYLQNKHSTSPQTSSLPKAIAEKTQRIWKELSCGKDYRFFLGKRLKSCDGVVSIPISSGFRLVCKLLQGKYEFLALLTHADYDKCLATHKWVNT